MSSTTNSRQFPHYNRDDAPDKRLHKTSNKTCDIHSRLAENRALPPLKVQRAKFRAKTANRRPEKTQHIKTAKQRPDLQREFCICFWMYAHTPTPFPSDYLLCNSNTSSSSLIAFSSVLACFI